MPLRHTLLALSCLAAAAASSACNGTHPKIQWGPCDEGEFGDAAVTTECASVRVPLDYTLANSTTFSLGIVRVPAAVQPSRGSILHNFGGPGLEARRTLVQLSPLLQPLSGGAYDLLAFDPRGVGKTLPFTCVENEPSVAAVMLNELRSGDQADTARARLWARAAVDGSICAQYGNAEETAALVGTAFTARDFISVVDALGEDGLLRYWGFSYGTTLGATLAAMFPDRIDRMIIDGVQNPHDYYRSDADFEEWTDTDRTLSHFFRTCLSAGPSACPLAALNRTAAQLESDTWAWLDLLRDEPLAAGTSVLDLVAAKGFLTESLKNPPGWGLVAAVLSIVVYGQGELDLVEELLLGGLGVGEGEGEGGGVEESLAVVQSLWAIHCGDRVSRIENLAGLDDVADRLGDISRLNGDLVLSTSAHCGRWPWQAKEVYGGDFRARTRHPVLILGNNLDAHTPIRSAFNVSSGFEGSVVLATNGTGHTTITSPSTCLLDYTVAYWIDGTLPEEGTVCEAAHPWANYTWADVLQEAAGGAEGIARRAELLDAYMNGVHVR